MIYLDYASTTPMDPEVKKAMIPFFEDKFGNPSSNHFLGQEARVAIDKSRQVIADFLGCNFTEIYFTSGATEANNLAIKGINFNVRGSTSHIITSRIEHKSVLKPIENLAIKGLAEATYLPIDKNGVVNIENLKNKIKENTILVSIMYVNNETGVIQPIKEIGDIIKDYTIKNKSQYPLFHIDAVQAVGHLNTLCGMSDIPHKDCDLLSISAHKIYGPKGVGALYVKEGTPIVSLIEGGGHEMGLRAGTENVASIAGFSRAVELIKPSISNKISNLRDYFEENLLKNIKNISINGNAVPRAPHISNILFKGVEAESLIILLDQEGIMASSGSACQTKAIEPSYVLMAMGLSKKDAMSSVRFSLGKLTTKEEIDKALKVLTKTVVRLRQ